MSWWKTRSASSNEPAFHDAQAARARVAVRFVDLFLPFFFVPDPPSSFTKGDHTVGELDKLS